MFELPEAKRVRRQDLRGSSSEAESDEEDHQHHAALQAKLQARLANVFSTVDLDVPTAAVAGAESDHPRDSDAPPAEEDGNGEEFAFRLFSSTAPAAKVVIPDDDEGRPTGDGAMAKQRPISYYIAAEPTPRQREEFAYAAVSGEDVLKRAKQRCWGMEMPWRVTHVTAQGKLKGAQGASSSNGTAEDEQESARKRKRPGKKKRITLRSRDREAKKKAEEADKSKMSKEEHLKEKKKRLNRAKQLRRRAKAKDAKAAGGTAAAAGERGVADADSESGADH